MPLKGSGANSEGLNGPPRRGEKGREEYADMGARLAMGPKGTVLLLMIDARCFLSWFTEKDLSFSLIQPYMASLVALCGAYYLVPPDHYGIMRQKSKLPAIVYSHLLELLSNGHPGKQKQLHSSARAHIEQSAVQVLTPSRVESSRVDCRDW